MPTAQEVQMVPLAPNALSYYSEGGPPQLPEPGMTALDMFVSRSPTLKPVDRQEENKGKPADRYSQVIRRYLVRPTVLEARYVDTVNFKLGEEDIKKIPKAKQLRPTDPDLRGVQHGSLMYRFRCVKLAEDAKEISEDEFVVADTAWPAHITVEGKDADGTLVTVSDLRRMTQFGKDLPVDITKMVTLFFKEEKEKPFSLNVVLNREKEGGGARHALAVEEIEIVRHDLVATEVLQQKIDFKTTEDGIKRLLSPSTDDDDITMDPSELTIGLQDPCLAKMWETPVKSKHCRHWECFDLDTWLKSRPETGREESLIHYELDNEGAFISGVDVWKCPLCGEDARPEKLRVDEWMQSVREKLIANGLAEVARAIVVSPGGSWKMKEDKEVAGISLIHPGPGSLPRTFPTMPDGAFYLGGPRAQAILQSFATTVAANNKKKTGSINRGSFTERQKLQAIWYSKLIIPLGKKNGGQEISTKRAVKDLGISRSTLRGWRRQETAGGGYRKSR